MSEQEENKNLSGKPGISGPTSMSKTEIDDFEEALAMLRAVGVDAMVCNTPVAVSVSSVKCGLPSELGDESIDDYVLIPKALVGHHPEMFVPASGDSMLDAGFEDGDLLRVVKELSRMAVMSFARPVSMWDVNSCRWQVVLRLFADCPGYGQAALG